MNLSPTRYVLCCMLPSVDGLTGLDQMDVKAFLSDLKKEAPLTMRITLFLGVWAFILTPILTLKIPLPSFLLSRRLQDEHTHRLTDTRIYLLRQLVFAIKAIAGLCWGKDPKVRRELNLKLYDADKGGFRS
jgi:hypothetical protein